MIRGLRRSRGQSQYTLAELLVEVSGNDGVTREQVARWERGKRIPGPYWRHWLSAALRVPREELDAAARYGRRIRASGGERPRRADDGRRHSGGLQRRARALDEAMSWIVVRVVRQVTHGFRNVFEVPMGVDPAG